MSWGHYGSLGRGKFIINSSDESNENPSHDDKKDSNVGIEIRDPKDQKDDESLGEIRWE